MNVTFDNVVQAWATGYVAMFLLMAIVCFAVNPKFMKDFVNWVILLLVSVLSWMGFAFMVVVFGVAYIDYIKNNNYDKDSEK